METLDVQTISLTDQAAAAALELVLRRAGLTPDPFAADHPHDQLRAALHHTDLLSPGDIPAQPPSDSDIARVTLLYLAEYAASCRAAIIHLIAHSPELGPHAAFLPSPLVRKGGWSGPKVYGPNRELLALLGGIVLRKASR